MAEPSLPPILPPGKPRRRRKVLGAIALLLVSYGGCNWWNFSRFDADYRLALEEHLRADPADAEAWYAPPQLLDRVNLGHLERVRHPSSLPWAGGHQGFPKMAGFEVAADIDPSCFRDGGAYWNTWMEPPG